ncbi:MAG: DUF1573 domain-containing protein [Fuerstiella sp.]|nr:DUF1573 domain-containing protein [Fuerstiella sp.]MCP4858585.1 DUF1573 domain-containing protein [Fuerstiella sp.]
MTLNADNNTDRADLPETSPWRTTAVVCVGLLPCLGAWLFAMSPSDQAALTITKSRPSLLFATYMYHHGEEPVQLAAVLESEFPFVNKGDAPVTIGDITTSCGCMRPRLSKQTVAPGEMGWLTVPIQMVNQSPGPHEYTLTVNYTDTVARQTTLTIKAAFPQKMVVVQPKALYLSQRSTKPLPFNVAISDFRDTPLRVTSVKSTAPFVSAELSASAASGIVQASHQEGTPGSKAELRGEVAGGIPRGRHHVLVTATTDDVDFPVVTIPMLVNGPAFPPGEAPITSPSQLRLLASDHPGTRRAAKFDLVMPSKWQVSHASVWPSELEVTYGDPRPFSDHEQTLEVIVKLSALPAKGVADGVVQLIANDGRDLVTVKVTFVTP